METALKDLQEAMRSRNPESLPALIHAAQLTDSSHEEKKTLESTIAELNHEIAALKEEHALKIRSMKQQLEKLKAASLLEKQKGAITEVREEVPAETTKKPTVVKTLTQAHARIK